MEITSTATTQEPTKPKPTKPKPTKPKPTKRAELIRLLSRKNGATSAVLCPSLGWQAHSLRAAISGLRKAGYVIEAIKPQDGGATLLRITKGKQVS